MQRVGTGRIDADYDATASRCSYDRPCIERWLQQGNCSCPATGQALAAPVTLVPNVALRNSIEEWAEKHTPWLLVRCKEGLLVCLPLFLKLVPPSMRGAFDACCTAACSTTILCCCCCYRCLLEWAHATTSHPHPAPPLCRTPTAA